MLTFSRNADSAADCGMTHLTNAAVREDLKKKGLGDDKVDSVVFGEIKEY